MCVAIACRISSYPLWLCVWGCELGERRDLVHKSCQPFSAAVDNAGCQVSMDYSYWDWWKVWCNLTLTYARLFAFNSSFHEFSFPVDRTTMLRRMLDSLELSLLPSPSPLSHMSPIMQSDHKLGSMSYKPLLARPTAGEQNFVPVIKGSRMTLMTDVSSKCRSQTSVVEWEMFLI